VDVRVGVQWDGAAMRGLFDVGFRFLEPAIADAPSGLLTASLSNFHFVRAFKTAMGQSPHQYVSAKRLECAKALLIRGDRPLADIALALNFSSQANFSKAFRKFVGRAPSQYRDESWSRDNN